MSERPGFRFERATRADEPEIRALVGGLAMPGSVHVRFEREPDYFLGTTIQGDPCDVLIARHVPDGELAGVMVRADRRVYLDGAPERVVYIGQIRIAPRFRGRWLMARAVAELRDLREGAARYFGVIASDNPVALGSLAGPRPPGSPTVTHIAHLRSMAFVLHRHMRQPVATMAVRSSHDADLEEIAAFLRREGARRQLFPVFEAAHLRDGRAYRGLRCEDLCYVRRDGEIAGVLGSWDQGDYKQEVVAGYSPRLGRLRPAYDLLARMLGARPLPRRGGVIRTAFGCLRCVADDDPDVFAALLRAARERALNQGQAFLMLGFDERDPLLQRLGRSLHVSYRSEVFMGSFGSGHEAVRLDGRPVYVEIGTL